MAGSHFYSYGTQVGMLILFHLIGRHEQIMRSSRRPRFTGSQRHHANLIDPCRERRVGNGKASNHVNPLRTGRMLAAASWAASRHQQRLHGGATKPILRRLSTRSALPLPTPTARSPPMVCSVTKCCRRCRRPLSSCSHHLRANLPNAGIVRGDEHGSFSRGDEASSSMKGCSLCM